MYADERCAASGLTFLDCFRVSENRKATKNTPVQIGKIHGDPETDELMTRTETSVHRNNQHEGCAHDCVEVFRQCRQ